MIDDVKDIGFPRGTEMPKHVKFLIKVAKSFLKWYRKSAKDHDDLLKDSDEHWAVKAKPVTRVGRFVAPSWVGTFDDNEARLDEEQSDEDEFGDEAGDHDDDEGGDEENEDEDEGSEDYSEEEDGKDYSGTDGEVEGSDEDFSDEP